MVRLLSANEYLENEINAKIGIDKASFKKIPTALAGGLKQELKERKVEDLDVGCCHVLIRNMGFMESGCYTTGDIQNVGLKEIERTSKQRG